ncbi:AAA family ATPase, partial [Heliobacterium undosum]
LYGKYFELSFHKDVTFLYGMNGCGKTTILNILHHIISGNLLNLRKYDFRYLELICADDKENHKSIKIKKSSINSNAPYEIVFEDISGVIYPLSSGDKSSIHDEFTFYKSINHDDDSIENEDLNVIKDSFSQVREKIRSVFTPIYLPLTRKDGNFDERFSRRPSRPRTESYLDSSVRRAVILVKDYNQNITYLENKRLESLKGEVLHKALLTQDFSIDELLLKNQSLSVEDRANVISAISDLRISVEEDLNTLIYKIEESKNSYYINEKHELEIISPIGFANYISAVSQLNKFRETSNIIRKANEVRKRLRSHITNLLSVVNNFFYDGGKEIYLDNAGLIKFRNLGTEEPGTSVTALSSGEKQILIFFVYIILGLRVSNNTGIFIIDEPELSLHLEWQQKFVPSLLNVTKEIQMVFATHSPEIIGDMLNNCVEVRGY